MLLKSQALPFFLVVMEQWSGEYCRAIVAYISGGFSLPACCHSVLGNKGARGSTTIMLK